MTDLTLADVGIDAAETTVDLVPELVARMALLLDQPVLAPGDPLPLLWHWACFTPTAPTADLGVDGHPQVGAALAAFPRRMWGAGSVEVESPLVVGQPATKHSRIATVRDVDAKSGALCIATVEHRYEQASVERLREEQTIVYRAPGPPVALPEGTTIADPPVGGWRRIVEPDPRLMFRYSAVTFNTHRIHYDLPYATEVEGYPALVFQGPLSALLVAAAAAAESPSPLRAFTFKATNPIFVGAPFTITGVLDGAHGTAAVIRNDGAVAMEVSYEI